MAHGVLAGSVTVVGVGVFLAFFLVVECIGER